METKIYGTGCSKCNTLFENVQTALDAAGTEAHLEKAADLAAIANAGVMTPALERDKKIVSSGKVLCTAELPALLPKQEPACCRYPCTNDKNPDTEKCRCRRKSPVKRLLAYILAPLALLVVAVMLIRKQ